MISYLINRLYGSCNFTPCLWANQMCGKLCYSLYLIMILLIYLPS